MRPGLLFLQLPADVCAGEHGVCEGPSTQSASLPEQTWLPARPRPPRVAPPPSTEETRMGEKHPGGCRKDMVSSIGRAARGWRHQGPRVLPVAYPDTWPSRAAAGQRLGEPATLPLSAAKSPPPQSRWGPGDSHPHSLFFLSTGTGTTWKILALWSSVSRVTQVGRKLPLKPTNTIFSER